MKMETDTFSNMNTRKLICAKSLCSNCESGRHLTPLATDWFAIYLQVEGTFV